jgi:CMP-N-acetylneuraminic acid synthetase
MIKGDTIILGVIPARGGSKGVPGKNIRPVLGKPLIAYSIECGLKCSSIDRLVVSTDSEEIADIARKLGAEVPFLRPEELAGDTVPMLPVMRHSITSAEEHYGRTVRALVLLDPTGALRTVDDVESCLKLFEDSDCDAVISGNTAHRSPYFNMVIQDTGYVRLVIPTSKPIGRRQDCPVVYDLNTVVWVYSRRALMEEKARIPERTLLYFVPPERAIDVDTELDLKILEFLMDERIRSLV